VDGARGLVSNVAWSGPGPPAHPSFPITKGLTGIAVAERRTVNVGDVASHPNYLTTFGGTRSEIIVPVFRQGTVVGTIDVESEKPNAFDPAAQSDLDTFAKAIRALWQGDVMRPA
jgi:GAF domain-containing protein